MTSLAIMQRNFIRDCLSGKLSPKSILMAGDIDTGSISGSGLMGIYQQSALANISHSLSLTYPVIEKLVGAEFFVATCRHYIRKNCPKSANMDDYGESFARFLTDFEPAQQLSYLTDVASLEWHFHQSSLADDAPTTDWSTLTQVSDLLQLHFSLSPSTALLQSSYPIAKIWQLNQAGIIPENPPAENNIVVTSDDDKVQGIDLDAENHGQSFVVIYRQALKTFIKPLSSGEFSLLHAFQDNENFEQAIIAASCQESEISIDVTLKMFIDLGIIVGFTEREPSTIN